MADKTATKATAADEKGVAATIAATKAEPKPEHPKLAAPAVAPPDPTAPVPHEPSKADVIVLVPKSAGQYGIVHPGGSQVLHEISPRDEGGGSIQVHPDHLQRVLFSIQGSKLLKPPALSAEQEAAEAARPVGRQAGPPLTTEEVAAHAAANTPAAPAAEPKAKSPAKK